MLMCFSAGPGHGGAAGHWGRCRPRQRRAGSSGWWAPASSWLAAHSKVMFSALDSLVSTSLPLPTLLFPQLVSWTPWPLWVWLRTDTASATSLASSIRKLSAAGRYIALVAYVLISAWFNLLLMECFTLPKWLIPLGGKTMTWQILVFQAELFIRMPASHSTEEVFCTSLKSELTVSLQWQYEAVWVRLPKASERPSTFEDVVLEIVGLNLTDRFLVMMGSKLRVLLKSWRWKKQKSCAQLVTHKKCESKWLVLSQ